MGPCLSHCTSLTSVKMSNLSKLSIVGGGFLVHDPNLLNVDMTNIDFGKMISTGTSFNYLSTNIPSDPCYDTGITIKINKEYQELFKQKLPDLDGQVEPSGTYFRYTILVG